MAKYVLAVYDACQVYLERLMDYAGNRSNLSFCIKGYTDLTILADEMRNNRIDAVLFSIDDAFMGNVENYKGFFSQIMVNEMIVLILGEQHSAGKLKMILEEKGYENEIRIIEKYQSAETILLEVDEYIQHRKGRIDQDWQGDQLRVKGLYSPIDKITHPEAAPLLKDREDRVLYLNLEPFSGVDSYADIPAKSDLADVIFYYKTDPVKLPEILNRIRGKLNGMDYLSGPADPDDLEILSREDWPGFLRALSLAGDYQLLIIDSSLFSRKLFDAIFTYGTLYIPTPSYDSTRTYRSVLTAGAAGEERRRIRMASKMEAFRSYFEENDLSRYKDRILEVQFETD